MKKIFSIILMLSCILTAHASFTLTWDYEDENEGTIELSIIKDTTIIISDYKEDFFGDGMVMSIKGSLVVSKTPTNLTVGITRPTAGLKDEFCLGNCVSGNGEQTQVLTPTLLNENNIWYTHFYPTEPSVTTIAYRFDDGENAITVTVKYCYQMEDTAVENVTAGSSIKGIYNLLGQKMPTDDINELPNGIYVVNGKKHIKQ